MRFKYTFRAALAALSMFLIAGATPGSASTDAFLSSKPPVPDIQELIAKLNGPDITENRPKHSRPLLHRAGQRIELKGHRSAYAKQLADKAAELRAQGNFVHLNRAARRREVRQLKFS